jgi:regulator of protease activity HflC (stomatin/prohibitin superfamily)
VKAKVTGVVAAIAVLALIVGIAFCTETVSPGQVKVGALWGSVQNKELTEGFHVVNPFKTWTAFDCRDKAIDLVIPLQTRDQQTSLVDMTIQFNVIDSSASIALADVGRFEDLVSVQLTPQTRSIARESGKEIKRAEDLFLNETQLMMQDNTLAELNKRLTCKGINVQRVLIRNIQLPEHITNAIKAKKVREQQVEEQKAELARFATEQEQKIKQAHAERLAAEEAAEQIKTLADAQAYEIKKINEAMADSPAYIQLQALETLAQMSKDPATKLYFLNGDSPQPFPLLNIK